MRLPLLWFSLAFMAGIVLASLLQLPFYVWLAAVVFLAVGAVLSAVLLPRHRVFLLPTLQVRLSVTQLAIGFGLCATAMLGGLRYQLTVPPDSISQLSWFNDGRFNVLVTGTLVDPPDVRDTYINLRLRAQQVDTGTATFTVGGLLLARTLPNQTFQYGDVVRVRGRLATPPSDEGFSYRDYLARQGIRSYMTSAEVTLLPGNEGNPFLRMVYSLKDRALSHVYRLFLDPEASLLAGILLGVDTGLSARLQQAFNDTGTSHIIAISGFNIAVIAGVFAVVFNRLLGRRRGAVAAALGIGSYTIFVGADAAVVRAALMGMVGLLAVQVGRRQTGINTLAAVAALMALLNPNVLWDVGFQLSLFATLGLILYGTPFMNAAARFLERRLQASDAQRAASILGQFVLLTFAAQLTTLPIMAYHFQQISLISPLANALILPAQPAVMILGGLAVFFSFFLFPLGQLVAWAAWPLTAYTIRLVEFFDAMPHGVIYLGSFSLAFVVLFYFVLLGVTFAGDRLKAAYESLRGRFRELSLVTVLIVLFIGTVFAWRLAAASPDGRLHVTFLDVGSADAVLIQTTDGRHILIDGGPSTAKISDALGRRFSPLDHTLDWLVLASTDENQVGSLQRLLPRFPASHVLLGGPEQASFSSQALMNWLSEEQVPVTEAEEGQSLDLGGGAKLRVVNVSPRGSTLLVEWDSFRVLLPIGANLDTLDALGQGRLIGPVSVLLLSQSGYAPLTPPELLQQVNPQLVVISAAAGDPDGLPNKETLDALESYSVLQTDSNGWIDVSTDGGRMWVVSQKTSSQ
jgi:competence protein ComEC